MGLFSSKPKKKRASSNTKNAVKDGIKLSKKFSSFNGYNKRKAKRYGE